MKIGDCIGQNKTENCTIEGGEGRGLRKRGNVVFFSGNTELTIFTCRNAEMAIMNGSGLDGKLPRNRGIDKYLRNCGMAVLNERERNEPKIAAALNGIITVYHSDLIYLANA